MTSAEDLVVVLGPPGSGRTLLVDTVDAVLAHVLGHLRGSGGSPGGTGDTESTAGPERGSAGSLRFSTTDGERLDLRLAEDWRTLRLERTGVVVPVQELETEVRRVLDQRVAGLRRRPGEEATWAPPERWDQLVAELHDGLPALSVEVGHHGFDSRGFFHNLFVHGGRP